MGYIIPTGHWFEAGAWTYPERAYDNNTSTSAVLIKDVTGYFKLPPLSEAALRKINWCVNWASAGSAYTSVGYLSYMDNGTMHEIVSVGLLTLSTDRYIEFPMSLTDEQIEVALNHINDLYIGLKGRRLFGTTFNMAVREFRISVAGVAYVGDKFIKDVFIGNNKAEAVYKGNTQIL